MLPTTTATLAQRRDSTQKSIMGSVSGGATTGSGANGTANSRFSSQKQGSSEEADKLNEKLRMLRDENTKLKDLLKRNEAMIENKLNEGKLE